MEYKRREGESLLDYQIRLYSNKVSYGLTNNEIGVILNIETNQNIDESAYRKPIQAILSYSEKLKKKWFEEGYKSASGEDGQVVLSLEAFAEKEKNIRKREMLIQTKQSEINRFYRLESRVDALKQTILDYANDVEDINPINGIEPEELRKLQEQDNEAVAVLTLSDWHYGEEINNFISQYNSNIFDSMIDKLTNDTILYCKTMKVKTLKVVSMGDLMSGMIHLTTRLSNEKDIVEQTLYVAEKLAQMIELLSKHIPEIEFYSTVDNHGRINPNYKEHVEKESFTLFLHHIVELRIKDKLPNVKVMPNEIGGVTEYDIGVMDIFDRQAIFVHGHNDGLKADKIKDLILFSQVSRPICVFMGHFHKNFEDEIHGIDVIVNPSLVPTGEYAKKLRASSLSRQKLTVFNKDKNENVYREGTFYITL